MCRRARHENSRIRNNCFRRKARRTNPRVPRRFRRLTQQPDRINIQRNVSNTRYRFVPICKKCTSVRHFNGRESIGRRFNDFPSRVVRILRDSRQFTIITAVVTGRDAKKQQRRPDEHGPPQNHPTVARRGGGYEPPKNKTARPPLGPHVDDNNTLSLNTRNDTPTNELVRLTDVPEGRSGMCGMSNGQSGDCPVDV